MKAHRLRLGSAFDRYVASAFLRAFAVSLLTVLGLFTVLDLAANVDEYLQTSGGLSLANLGLYYLLNLPFLYQQAAPFVILGACLYTVVRIVRTNEWIAVLGAGVSMPRLLLPLLATSVALSAASLGLRESYIQTLRQEREAVRERLAPRERFFETVWARDRAGRPFFVERLVVGADGDVRIEGLEANVQTRDGWDVLCAPAAEYVGEAPDGHWRLQGAKLRRFAGEELRQTRPAVLEILDFTPDDVLLVVWAREDPTTISLHELERMIAADPDNGQLRTLLQAFWASLTTSTVFLLIALPFAVRDEKREVVRGVLIGIMLCFLHFVADLVGRSLGSEGALSPLLAAWLPVVSFGSLGAVLYASMKT